MVKIVHITENPIAGAPINLSNALNKYHTDRVQSRHIAQSDRNEDRVFPSDIIIDTVEYDFLRQQLETADIIHFHNFYRNQHLFRKYPSLWEIVKMKKRVWQVHSPRETSWVNLEEGLQDPKAKHLVIAQYHPRQWPECTIVPNIIDIEEGRFLPLFTENEKPRVVYSPSRIRFSGWDNKGWDETQPVMQELVNEHKITADVIFNVSHNECLRRRGTADISIDEIVTGSYHLVSLESLSAGLLTIAGLDQTQIKTLLEVSGSREAELPWIVANKNTLKETILNCVENPTKLRDKKVQSRHWMERYWHPKVMTEKFLKIYEEL